MKSFLYKGNNNVEAVAQYSQLSKVRSTPQNDRVNLRYVKDIKVVGKKRLEMVIKPTFVSCRFWATAFIIDTSENPLHYCHSSCEYRILHKRTVSQQNVSINRFFL